jgi:hypothetical protein
MSINIKQKFPFFELLCVILLAVIGVVLAHHIDLFESFYQWSRVHEDWQVDEIITVFVVLAIGLSIYSFRRWQEQVREHAELQ